MELNTVVQAWGLPGPHSFVPLTAGYMNLTYRMDNPAGSYVLRIYQAVSDPARIRHEHAVMQDLGGEGLSFDVPAPLRAATGESLVTAAGARGPVSASLSPFCAGEHADPWLMPEAFTRGYAAYQALAPEEIAALPLLIRLRKVERLVQFIGRYRQGYDSAELLRIMANWVLRADQWLAAYGADLVDRVSNVGRIATYCVRRGGERRDSVASTPLAHVCPASRYTYTGPLHFMRCVDANQFPQSCAEGAGRGEQGGIP